MQEAHDLALVSQAATLESRVPFVHFFDGFRTSHEIARIDWLEDDDLGRVGGTAALANVNTPEEWAAFQASGEVAR